MGQNNGDVGGGFECDPATHCTGDRFICGRHDIPECGSVDCGECQYVRVEAGAGDVVADVNRAIHVAYQADGAIWYSPSDSAALAPEQVSEMGAGNPPVLHVAADGSIHVVWGDTMAFYATRGPEDTTWTTFELGSIGDYPEFGITSDAEGAIHVVFVGEDSTTRAKELFHSTRTTGDFATQSVDLGAGIASYPMALARSESGAITVAVRTHSTVTILDLIDGQFAVDETAPAFRDVPRADFIAGLSAAYTSDGVYHLVGQTGDRTLRSGAHGHYLKRANAAWELLEYPAFEGLEIAAGPEQQLHRVTQGPTYSRFLENDDLYLGSEDRCGDGHLRMAIDANDQPHIIYSDLCANAYMTPIAKYPTNFHEDCEAAINVLCGQACSCGGEDCCFKTEGGSRSICNGSEQGCQERYRRSSCTDRAADPLLLADCMSVIEAPSMCTEASADPPHWLMAQACFRMLYPEEQ